MTVTYMKVPAAADELGLGQRAVRKLIATGLLPVEDPDALQPRIPVEDVQRLATLPAPKLPALAVHVGPLVPVNDTDRQWIGYHAQAKLAPTSRLLAWSRWWQVGRAAAEALVGGYLVGDVAGVIPADMVGRVVGFQSVAGGIVAFDVDPTDCPEGLAWSRFRAEPGPLWQALWGVTSR